MVNLSEDKDSDRDCIAVNRYRRFVVEDAICDEGNKYSIEQVRLK